MSYVLIVSSLALLILAFFNLNDSAKVWYLTTFRGYTKVYFHHGYYSFNEDFVAAIKFYKDGTGSGPRYACTGVGRVICKADGTGEYFGTYRWSLSDDY